MNGTEKMWLVPQETVPVLGHSWVYAANGDTITETCSRGGCEALGGSYTVKAPGDLTYNGHAKEATVEGTMTDVDKPGIVYKQGSEQLTMPPHVPRRLYGQYYGERSDSFD